jgi:hypothetical protein
MCAAKSKARNTAVTIWLALGLFLAVAVGAGVRYLAGSNLKPETKVAASQLGVSMLGFGGAIAAFGFALMQYRRAEQWKRVEFIANEIKDFESDAVVQNALLMIDWGKRRINLFLVANPTNNDLVNITRDVQWKALLPHTVKRKFPEYHTAALSSNEGKGEKGSTRFTFVEARIRDTYDVFLTRLDRFANFIEAGVISAEELKPYIRYWVDAMTNNENPAEDAAWRCTLLTYINFYDYSGVKFLLKRFDKNVESDSPIYNELISSLPDQVLAKRLMKSISSGKQQT